MGKGDVMKADCEECRAVTGFEAVTTDSVSTAPMTPEQFAENSYLAPRLLPSGEWAALHRFIFTTGLVVGIDEHGRRTRFCYERFEDAFAALATWDGRGDPPGPWIKEKGEIERSNPARSNGIPIVVEHT